MQPDHQRKDIKEEVNMDIQLADVMIHIDENLTADRRASVETQLREIDGVVSVNNPEDKPHLTLVPYRSDRVDPQTLLAQVKAEGVHAELVGL
ncbi:ATP-binding protein [Lamprobacter modestohalophilus]|uniref:ATP-binding protein n=1 Tax=Lamprobacter modestohalophilus TaxID=1064514 RepID=UPI002ADEB1CF|nr:ATP-binding protein [Lamprobacter modestohalophilus]MEA1052082.1 ATP-binding protein [Lamprobacter modestohalophilus]